MKYLTIIRHAKSSWENPDLDDLVRPINEKGIKSIEIIGNHLKEKKILPDLIITSPATRALHTATRIGALLNYTIEEIQIKQEIYFGSYTSILSIIKNINNKHDDVFLFGHEPVLSDLIEHLTKKKLEKFTTCAVYRIALNENKWENISIGKEVFFISPKLFIKI